MALSLTPPPDAMSPQRSTDAPPVGTVLPPHYAQCFGCGADHPTGLHLSVTVAEGVAVDAVFRVAEAHQGAPGLAHGGVLATAADEALGFLNWLLRRPAVTARLEVDYLLPVPVGTDLHLRAECTAVAGRKTFVRCEGRLDAPDGPTALRATGLFLVVPLEHFRKHASGRETMRGDEGSYNP
ncbi:MAG TPA: PaaI family thioesterase [Frankiaceae bacterium]|nr:PaaI family thioesterase [Frankiaceae bacterium]